MRLAPLTRSALADAAVDRVDGGGSAGEVRIYSGSAPATITDAPAGDLLATFTLGDPAFGAASNGVATGAGLPIATTGADDGTAGYARVVQSDGTVVWDTESVGVGTGEVQLDNLSIATAQAVNLTALTVTMPEGTV